VIGDAQVHALESFAIVTRRANRGGSSSRRWRPAGAPTIFDTPRNPCLPIQRATRSAFQNATDDQREVDQKRRNGKQQADLIEPDQQRRHSAGPAIFNRHPKRDHAQSSSRFAAGRATFKQLRPANVQLALVVVAFWNADLVARWMGRQGLRGVSKIVALLLAAIAVSLIRRGWHGV